MNPELTDKINAILTGAAQAIVALVQFEAERTQQAQLSAQPTPQPPGLQVHLTQLLADDPQAQEVRRILGEKFWNVPEVALLLRVSPRTIYDWVSKGKIPYRKAGSHTIFDRDEIFEWTKPKASE